MHINWEKVFFFFIVSVTCFTLKAWLISSFCEADTPDVAVFEKWVLHPHALSLIVVSVQCQAEAKWRVNSSSCSEKLVEAKEGLRMGPMGPVHRNLRLSEVSGWEAWRGLTPVRWTALSCVPVDVGTIQNKWRSELSVPGPSSALKVQSEYIIIALM